MAIYTTKSGKLFKVFVSLLVAIILSLTPPGQSEAKKSKDGSGVMLVNCVWLNLEMKWLALNLVQQPTLLANICNLRLHFIQYLHSAQNSRQFAWKSSALSHQSVIPCLDMSGVMS